MFLVLCSTLLIFVTVIPSLWSSFSQRFKVHSLCLLFKVSSDKILQSEWFFYF